MSGHERYDELITLALLEAAVPSDASAGEIEELRQHLATGCERCRALMRRHHTTLEELTALIPRIEPRAEIGRGLKSAVRERAYTERAQGDHAQWEELLALASLDLLSDAERTLVEAHIGAGCDDCESRWRPLAAAASAIAGAVEPLQPRAGLRDELSKRVREATPVYRPALEAAPDASARRDVELVGRARERAIFERRLAGLERGEGAVIAVEAEAGLGKSRLIDDILANESERGWRSYTGRAVPIARAERYAPFVDVLASWAGIDADTSEPERAERVQAMVHDAVGAEWLEVLPFVARVVGVEAPSADALAGLEGQALERRIHEAMRTLFACRARRRPMVLVLEDLHWADDATCALLEALLPLAETHPLVIVYLTRPDGIAGVARLDALAQTTLALRYDRVRLSPLSERDSMVLARGLFGAGALPEPVARLIRDKGAGNPFYIGEMVRTMIESGAVERRLDRLVAAPDIERYADYRGIGAVILSRVTRLSAPVRAVLETASVVGRRFHRRVLEAVIAPEIRADLDLDATLEQLESMQFIARDDGHSTASVRVLELRPERAYAFRHALLQEVVLGSLVESERKALHARCAAAIENVFARRLHDQYAALAYQYSCAGDLERAHAYLLEAGEYAAESAASADALAFFRDAYATYRDLHGDGGDRSTLARMERNIAIALLNTGRLTESLDHLNAALRLHGEWVPQSRAAMQIKFAADLTIVLLRLYTGTLAKARRPASARERAVFELLYNRCRAQNIVDDDRRAADNLAAIRHVGHLDPASVDNSTGILAAAGAFFGFSGLSFGPSRRFLDLARAIAEQGGERDRFLYRTMAFVVHFLEGDWSREHDIDEPSLQWGLRHGLLWDADVYLGMECERSICTGDYEAAAARIELLASLCDRWGYAFARSNQLAETVFLLTAQRKLDEALEAVQRWYDLRVEPSLQLLALGARARIEILAGRLDAAAATLGEAARLERGGGPRFPYYTGLAATARLALSVARIETVLAAGGRPDAKALREGKRICRTALVSATKCARDRGETLSLAARLEWAAGRRADALAYWQQADQECERLGDRAGRARAWADMAGALAEAPAGGADANELRERARAEFVELGLQWDLARLETQRRRRRAA